MRKSIIITEEQKIQIADYFNEGLAIKKIADKIGLNYEVLRKYLKNNNITRGTKAENAGVTLEMVMDMLCTYNPISAIAEKYNTSPYIIKKMLIDHNVNDLTIIRYKDYKKYKGAIERNVNDGVIDISRIKDEDLDTIYNLLSERLIKYNIHLIKNWRYKTDEGVDIIFDFYCPEINQAWYYLSSMKEECNNNPISISDQVTIMNHINSKSRAKIVFTPEKYEQSKYTLKSGEVIEFSEAEGTRTAVYSGLRIHEYEFEYVKRAEDDHSATTLNVRSDEETVNRWFNYIYSYYKNGAEIKYTGDIGVDTGLENEKDDINFTKRVARGDRKNAEKLNSL